MEIKNLGQLIQHLATKAGIDTNDKNLINLLSNSELTKITLHSDFVKSLDESLLSVEAATDNHPVIGAKYKAQALNAFDKKMEAIINGSDLDDEIKTELLGTQSSFKRFEALNAKLAEHFTAKANTKGDKKDDVLQKQIDDLQKELKTSKELLVAKETEHKSGIDAVRTEYLFKSKLSGKKTVLDQLPEAVRFSSINNLITQALQDKDAKVVYDEQGNAMLIKSDGSKLYGANHTQITLDDLIDTTLAQNKILVVSQQQQQNQQQQQQVVIPGGAAPTITGTNQSVVDFNQQQLAAMTSGTGE